MSSAENHLFLICLIAMTTMGHLKMTLRSDSPRRWSLLRTTWEMWCVRTFLLHTKKRTSSPLRSVWLSRFHNRMIMFIEKISHKDIYFPWLGGESCQEPDLFWLLQLQWFAQTHQNPASYSRLCPCEPHFCFQQDGQRRGKQRLKIFSVCQWGGGGGGVDEHQVYMCAHVSRE